MEIDCNKLYIYAASTLALHFAPIKWIASFYGYHKIWRLYLLYAQQGVFAITFITRSSALYFSYTDLLVTKDVKGEFVDEHVQNSRLEYICFVFAAISIGLCEAISMDSTILSEKHIYNLPYTLQRIRVTWVKYYGLWILCHLHFYNTRGSYWITAFDNSQVSHQAIFCFLYILAILHFCEFGILMRIDFIRSFAKEGWHIKNRGKTYSTNGR